MKANPDDRSDNVKKIQKNIDMTIRNMEAAEELMGVVESPKVKKQLRAKNERRAEALKGLRNEIKDEAEYKKNNFE